MNYMFDKNWDWLDPSGAECNDEYHNELLLYLSSAQHHFRGTSLFSVLTLFYIFFCSLQDPSSPDLADFIVLVISLLNSKQYEALFFH